MGIIIFTLLLNAMVRIPVIFVLFAPPLDINLIFTKVASSFHRSKSNSKDQVLDKYLLIDSSSELQTKNSYIWIVMMMINIS